MLQKLSKKIEEAAISGWSGAGESVLSSWESASVLCDKQSLNVINQTEEPHWRSESVWSVAVKNVTDPVNSITFCDLGNGGGPSRESQAWRKEKVFRKEEGVTINMKTPPAWKADNIHSQHTF